MNQALGKGTEIRNRGAWNTELRPKSEKESWSSIPIGIVAWLIGVTFAAGGLFFAVNSHSQAIASVTEKIDQISREVSGSAKDVEWIKRTLEGCGPIGEEGAKVFVGNGRRKER